MVRRYSKEICLFFVITALVIGFAVMVHLVIASNKHAFAKELTTIQQYCGPEKATAFDALYAYDDHSSDEAREWVKECITR